MATQYRCECGLLTRPEDLDVSFAYTCPACGTDAPLLFADDAGEVVPYSAPPSPAMVESQRGMGIDPD